MQLRRPLAAQDSRPRHPVGRATNAVVATQVFTLVLFSSTRQQGHQHMKSK
jgi:hypothetical protein